ncbi:ABCB9 [Symbiodinium sp. CCMP2456]|nr:ABCB9 [Symbiodinium sp. CCMP2456]
MLIAHRLSTVMSSDKIVVMDKGVVVEQGTHEELLKNQNIYAGLVQRQLAKQANTVSEAAEEEASVTEPEPSRGKGWKGKMAELDTEGFKAKGKGKRKGKNGRGDAAEGLQEVSVRGVTAKGLPPMSRTVCKYCNLTVSQNVLPSSLKKGNVLTCRYDFPLAHQECVDWAQDLRHSAIATVSSGSQAALSSTRSRARSRPTPATAQAPRRPGGERPPPALQSAKSAADLRRPGSLATGARCLATGALR